MAIRDSFTACCRNLSALLDAGQGLSFSPFFSKERRKKDEGLVAAFSFSEFVMNICLIERGTYAFAPNTVWLNFCFESDPELPFSVYDLFAALTPGDFRCFTYTYTDTDEAIENCFSELNAFLPDFIKKVSDAAFDGPTRNSLIDAQKRSVLQYYGMKGSFDGAGGLEEKLRLLMYSGYHEKCMERIVTGAYADFAAGSPKKAALRLRGYRFKTEHEKMLEEFLKLPESAEYGPSASGEKAEPKKISGYVKALLVSVFGAVFSAGLMFAVYYYFDRLLYRGAVFVAGSEALRLICALSGSVIVFVLIFCLMKPSSEKLSAILSGGALSRASRKSPTAVVIRELLILTEIVSVLLCFFAANDAAAFYGDRLSVTERFFSFRRESYAYTEVSAALHFKGYYMDGRFLNEPYYVIRLKDGHMIDLYENTYRNLGFETKVVPLLHEKGIEVREEEAKDDLPVIASTAAAARGTNE